MSVNVGIISFAHMHAYGYAAMLQDLPPAQLVGIADDDAERGRQVAAKFDTKYYDSEEALLDDVQAVVVTTENARHKDKTLKAAAAGVDILCEKPLAASLPDATEMISACEQGGVQLMTAFPCRFAPAFAAASQMIAAGELGEILAIKGNNRSTNPGGWFVDKELAGGGTVMDHTVHIADLMRVVTGDEVAEVYCEMDTVYNPDLQVEDTGVVTLQFSQGCIGSIDCSWSRPPHYPIWGDATMCIIGEGGNTWLDLFLEHLDYYRNQDRSYNWVSYTHSPSYAMMEQFVGCVQSGEPVPVTGHDGLKALEVPLAAYESVQRGQPVNLPL